MARDTQAEGFTIAELAALAGVTVRTIRYYIAQGLLPSPGSLGPMARYADDHLSRLRLIRRLQRRHLPLADIRRQLEDLSDADVRAALAEPEPPEPASTGAAGSAALDYVRAVLGEPTNLRRSGPPYRLDGAVRFDRLSADELRRAAGKAPSRPPPGMPLRTIAQSAGERGAAKLPSAMPPAPPATIAPPDRSQWDRIVLTPDVELHVRRPLSRLVNKRVERLIAVARQVLEEDQP